MTLFQPTPNPVIPVPTAAWARAAGAARLKEALVKREEVIAREKENPIVSGWEPPVWRLCDALLGFEWVPADEVARVRSWLGKLLGEDGARQLEDLRLLLLLGGNRGGKTRYMMRTAVKTCLRGSGRRVWVFHETATMSIEYHHSLVHQYLPPHLRSETTRSKTTYISYNQKYGFAGNSVLLPGEAPDQPANEITFRNYEQEDTTIEGGEVDLFCCDELVPVDWVDTLKYRIATRDGRGLVGFTPIKGYSGTVKRILDGAKTILEETGWLLPKDGEEPLEHAALGLTREEYDEIRAAAADKRAATAPQARPGEFSVSSVQCSVEAGREFETVPRVQKGVMEDEAAVYFHSADNPYGNPKSVLAKLRGASAARIRERFYGVAEKVMASRFPKFDPAVHVLPAELIPSTGTNYQVLDPADGRNIFMLWIRVTPWAAYVYRECPGDYYLEGIGVPGPWALPDGKLADGRRGPAQDSFGWGYLTYKKVIGTVEGWESLAGGKPEAMSEGDWLRKAEPNRKKGEIIYERRIDSRYANASRLDQNRVTTMLEEFADVGLEMAPTDVMREEEGIQQVTDALDYNEAQPVSALNTPHLFVSAECRNLIFALQTWTGRDGLKGATLDPIATLRMFYQCKLGCRGEGEEAIESSGGGYY